MWKEGEPGNEAKQFQQLRKLDSTASLAKTTTSFELLILLHLWRTVCNNLTVSSNVLSVTMCDQWLILVVVSSLSVPLSSFELLILLHLWRTVCNNLTVSSNVLSVTMCDQWLILVVVSSLSVPLSLPPSPPISPSLSPSLPPPSLSVPPSLPPPLSPPLQYYCPKLPSDNCIRKRTQLTRIIFPQTYGQSFPPFYCYRSFKADLSSSENTL